MNINQATDYAFRAVLNLAKKPKGKVVDAQTISAQEVIPIRFLLKIMPSLIKSGIINSQRGVGGGYFLAKNPREISFLDVVEAIEGPIYINRCLADPKACSKNGAGYCGVHLALREVQKNLREDLQKRNFGELLKD